MFVKSVVILMLIFSLSKASTRKETIIKDLWGSNTKEKIAPTSLQTSTATPRYSNTNTLSDSCTCVDYFLCANDTINTIEKHIIDISLNPCNSYLQKCCRPENVKPEPSFLPPPQPKGCGYRNPNGVGFKIKNARDSESEFGEFPWMTAVFQRELSPDGLKKIPLYQCGGSLIHPRVVLTAAHCVKDKKNLEIRAGEWDTQTKKEQYPFQDKKVVDVVIHPHYIAGPLFNDIALLILIEPVEFAPHINVVCLPPQRSVPDDGRCFSSGWGKTNFAKESKYQAILKKVDLPLVQRSTCQENLRQTKLGEHFVLHHSFLCAGGELGKDTCKGDGGSPLVCPVEGYNERYVQVGIVAWGIECGISMIPGVYLNVALFRDWIDEELTARQLDIHYYKV